MAPRNTNEEIIQAYKETGSVWRAGKLLGLTGQAVHERLKALGYDLAGREWTEEEERELRQLAGNMTITEVAHRLGRPYSGVAMKISRLGIGERRGNRNNHVKIPRGAGYDKASVKKYLKEMDSSGDTVHSFARKNSLGVESLCRSIENNFPDWWEKYRREHSDLPEIACGYCERIFIPSTKKQVYCTRRCADQKRRDDSYFGGKRRGTIGLAEERCQLCGREGLKGLSSHHILGKENDPDNNHLIAICSGCHQIVTLLSARNFVENPEVWESLIQLCVLRKRGADRLAIETYVGLEITDIKDLDPRDYEYFGIEDEEDTE